MKEIIKKVLAFFILINILSVVCLAADTSSELVNTVSLAGETVTITGCGEDVSIFLLNPGKTVSDLNAIDSIDKFNDAVNYTNTVNIGKKDDFSITFTVESCVKDSTYLLYVKDKYSSFSKDIVFFSADKIYVDYNYAGSGNGSLETPFSTIEEARDYIRTINKIAPIEVIVAGGTHKLKSTIEFTAQDSGTAECTVTYKVADGSEFTFSGSQNIDISNTVKKVEDGNILGRVSSETARNLVEIDLEANNIPVSIADYLANLEQGHVARTVGIYLNDERQSVSRWPNVGYAETNSVNNDSLTLKIKGADEFKVARWANASDMYVEGYLKEDWYGEWVKVSSVDSTNLSLGLAYKPNYGMSNGTRIAVVNLIEEIDVPGEWYIDSNAMKLYYYPSYPLTDEDKLEICAEERNFINVKGAHYLNFEGFTFEKNAGATDRSTDATERGNGILISNTASNISIKNCVFRNIGMDAVYISNATHVDIDSCVIYDIGFRGIYVRSCGNIDTLESGNVTVSNNYISDTGRDSARNRYTSGVFIGDGGCVGVTVSGNTICNMKNSAIRYYGNLHNICNNEIYSSVKESADAGAIYSGRSFTQYGTVIQNNYFHDIGIGLTSHKAGAVFWDDNHSGNTFSGNIVDTKGTENSAGVIIGGGRDNLIENNIFMGDIAIFGADREITSFTDFYATDAFQSFTKAANNVADAKDITDADWKSAYKTMFGNIMENHKELMNGTYTRENIIKDNMVTGEISLGTKMNADSTKSGNTKYEEISTDVLNGFLKGTIGVDAGFAPQESHSTFKLIYPFNASVVNGEEVLLKWSSNSFANAYKYEISTDSAFTNIVSDGETLQNGVIVKGLDKGIKYYWRVTAVNNSKYLNYSVICDDVYSFTLADTVYLGGLDLDKEASQIKAEIVNDTSADVTVCIVAALKDITNMNLIDAKISYHPVAANTTISTAVDVSFEDTGDVLELYILDSVQNLIPYTIKYIFQK